MLFSTRSQRAAASLAVFAICSFPGFSLAEPPAPLEPAQSHPKFVHPLPAPAVIDATGGGSFSMVMRETVQDLGLVDTSGQPLMTTVWGYGREGGAVTYPGPTFEARSDIPVDVLWKNQLPGTHLLPVDTSLHWANPNTGIATVTHLHGGHTESASDGLPEAWFTQGFAEVGPTFVKSLYHYDNDQPGATLWYHDHALGITRLNVYAGLAGFYLLRDFNEEILARSGTIPVGPYERAIVIQDRQFDPNGQLYLPTVPPELPGCEEPGGPCEGPTPDPSAIAEFFGDYVLVNGVAWPKLEVEPRKYRLRFLNGSDSRFYILEFQDDAGRRRSFFQIGTDTGLLNSPKGIRQLLLAPGERAEVLVNFAKTGSVTLQNLGPDDPFKGCWQQAILSNRDHCLPSDGEGGIAPSADPSSTGVIMRFDVALPLDASVAEAKIGKKTRLAPRFRINPNTADSTRQVVLFEGLDNYGRLQPLLGTLDVGSLGWFESITENPGLNDTEIWEIYNVTEDAHPIHLHLVSFEVLGRQLLGHAGESCDDPEVDYFVTEQVQPQHDGAEGVGGRLVLCNDTPFDGPEGKPLKNERGPKDTVIALPGQVTRVIANFDREGRYVWHCHILSHEDHEMMRPMCVGDLTEANCGPLGHAIE